MSWKIPLSDLDYGDAETQAVLSVLESRWLTMGAVTEKFEAAFAEFLGVRHALAVSNATVALHLACRVLDIGPGDEIIVPSLSFVASANAVLYTGAEAVFADIMGEDDLTISPAAVEQALTPRTRAVMVMHYAGYPCNMVEIMRLAHRYNLPVIEDAAHAPGAALEGRMIGTWGDISCFSFFSNKNLSTGEGGMVVTNRDDIAEKARNLRSHAMTSLTWDRHQGHAHSYDVTDLGYNYRIDELRSALGLAQLARLPANNARRADLTRRYWDLLDQADAPGLGFPFRHSWGRSAHHIFPLLLPPDANRRAFSDHLRTAGIQTSIHYPPIHTFSYYRHRYPGISLPVTEAVSARQVTLPLYPGMADDDVDTVVEAVSDYLTSSRDGRHQIVTL